MKMIKPISNQKDNDEKGSDPSHDASVIREGGGGGKSDSLANLCPSLFSLSSSKSYVGA